MWCQNALNFLESPYLTNSHWNLTKAHLRCHQRTQNAARIPLLKHKMTPWKASTMQTQRSPHEDLGAIQQDKCNGQIVKQFSNLCCATLTIQPGIYVQIFQAKRRSAGRNIGFREGKIASFVANPKNRQTTRMKGWNGSQYWAKPLHYIAMISPKMAKLHEKMGRRNAKSLSSPFCGLV